MQQSIVQHLHSAALDRAAVSSAAINSTTSKCATYNSGTLK